MYNNRHAHHQNFNGQIMSDDEYRQMLVTHSNISLAVFKKIKQWYNNHHAQQHLQFLLFLVVNEGGLYPQFDFHGDRAK